MFKIATKEAYRFASNRGTLTCEDLWTLSLEDLDLIAKSINKQLKTSEEESFIGKKSKDETTLKNKLEILKTIIADKLEEIEKRKKRQENSIKRKELLEALYAKERQAIGEKSIEDLRKELEELDSE